MRRTLYLMIVLYILFGMTQPVSAQETDKLSTSLKDPLGFDVEWGGVALGVSYFRGTNPKFRFDMFTLKYSYFYWNIIRGGFALTRVFFIHGESVFGLRIPIDPEGRHEFRLGIGIGAGVMPSPRKGDLCDGFGEEFTKLLLGVDTAYLYHFYEWLALKAGIELHIPIAKLGHEQGCDMPNVEVVGYVGVVF